MKHGIKVAVAATLVLLMTGCASNMAAKKRVTQKFPANSRIAVLPFENLSGADKAAEKVTDYFLALLAESNKFELVEYGAVYENLRRLRIRSSSLVTDEQIDSLAAGLGINFILTGSVLEYEEYDNSFLGRVPQVSFNCRMIDCSTKKSIWVATSNARGDKGEIVFGIGAVRSSDNLARQMVKEAVDDIAGLFTK